MPQISGKRVYRVMASHALPLPKAPRGRQSSRTQGGTRRSRTSTCAGYSDGFEIKCDLGQLVMVTFTKDCCDDWEILAYRA